MKNVYFILLYSLVFTNCQQTDIGETNYNVRADIRSGSFFHSLLVSEDGRCYVIKGTATFESDRFSVLSADTSSLVHLDSQKAIAFFKKIEPFKAKPLIVGITKTDAPRVEIYYDGKKIYDANNWNDEFLDMFKPLIPQLPNGYNPFVNDN
jgi:hypothetical protein